MQNFGQIGLLDSIFEAAASILSYRRNRCAKGIHGKTGRGSSWLDGGGIKPRNFIVLRIIFHFVDKFLLEEKIVGIQLAMGKVAYG